MCLYLCIMQENATQIQGNEIDAALRLAHVSGIWAIDLHDGLSSLSEFQARVELVRMGAVMQDVPTPTAADFVTMNVTEKGKVVHADLTGAMRLNDGMCSVGAASLGKEITAAAQGSDVSGVVLRISSGGGEAQAGVHLAQVITDLRKSGKKVVSLVDRAGSAAYMVAAASDAVVMNGDMSQVGSIGAMYSINRAFAEAYKVYMQDIYADQSTKKNKSFNDYVASGDTSGLKAEVTQLAQMFIDQVTTQRGIQDNAQLSDTMQGDMFYAQDAITRGLADKVGTMSDAVNIIFQSAPQSTTMTFAEKTLEEMSIISKLFGNLANITAAETVDQEAAEAAAKDAQKEVFALQTKLDEQAQELETAAQALEAANKLAFEAQMDAVSADGRLTEMAAQLKDQAEAIAQLKADMLELGKNATALPRSVAGQRVGQANQAVNAGLASQQKAAGKGTITTSKKLF